MVLSKQGVKNVEANIIQEFNEPHQSSTLQCWDTLLIVLATKELHDLIGKIG